MHILFVGIIYIQIHFNNNNSIIAANIYDEKLGENATLPSDRISAVLPYILVYVKFR